MYQIKQRPEDFIVKEIPIYELDEKGEYSYFWLVKTDYTTMDAVKAIASRLNIPLKRIGFAGAKDKRAVTKQIISIKSISKEKVDSLGFKDIELEYIGNGNKPISLGDLKGNEFVIVVRNLSTKRIRQKDIIPNLYGPQRFSKNNAEIGKLLVQKNFKKAIELIDNEEAKEHIERLPFDFIGALRQIPLKTRKIYIHAYQSLLWNRVVEEYMLTNPLKNIKIPIIGFQTEVEEIKDILLKRIIQDTLRKEEVSGRDFIITQIKELSSEGGERDLFVKPENFSTNIIEDELNKDKLKAIVSFRLPKASYATVIIEKIFEK